ncbi:hypothetical protein [Kitasatospora sp. NPDC002965]|uniref:hypothetical protein n=1 Tax=Kitasatospora sp. NPDC002965 TaxID=3154775 RepID=UPI0033BDCA00
MRLRQAAVTTVGVLTLLLSIPTPASAASGAFEYQHGRGLPGLLVNPQSAECINIPGATEDDPAFAPWNLTTSTAVAFLEADCAGDVFRTMVPGTRLGNRLHLRSVLFS